MNLTTGNGHLQHFRIRTNLFVHFSSACDVHLRLTWTTAISKWQLGYTSSALLMTGTKYRVVSGFSGEGYKDDGGPGAMYLLPTKMLSNLGLEDA